MKEKEKKKSRMLETIITSMLILIGFILGYILVWSISALNGISEQSHQNNLERLKLEKEIALINNKNISIIDYECEYKLMNLTNYYNNELWRQQFNYEVSK